MGLWQDSSDLGLIIDGRFSLIVDGEFFFFFFVILRSTLNEWHSTNLKYWKLSSRFLLDIERRYINKVYLS